MNYSKIGERLKLIRERKGLSYEQIFEITKIQPSILKGIEEGKSLVSPVFLRGFIKTYASSLGLDPELLFQLSEVETVEKEEIESEEAPQKQEKTKKRYFLYLLPLSAFFLIFSVIWFVDIANNLSEKNKEEIKPSTNQDSEVQERVSPESQPISSLSPLKSSDQKNQESEKEKAQDETSLVSGQSLFQEIRNSLFRKEILIQSSQAMDIYFKLDKQSTITKRLNPFEWFHIKAQESIYLRFDTIQGDIQIFYNGKKVNLENYKGFFERKFL